MNNNFKHCHMYNYTIFSVVKLDFFIRALLLDSILALEKTTRTPRVFLVNNSSYNSMYFCDIKFHRYNGCLLIIPPLHLGYEPAGRIVHPPPPPQNDRRWVHFFAWVSSATKIFFLKKVDFVGDIES